MKIPKYIKTKANKAERLVNEARILVYEIEEWMEKHGIDENKAREAYIIDDTLGLGHLINIDVLEAFVKEADDYEW